MGSLTSDHTIREDVISLVPIDDLLSHQVFYSHILHYQRAETEIDPVQLWGSFLVFYGLPAFCVR